MSDPTADAAAWCTRFQSDGNIEIMAARAIMRDLTAETERLRAALKRYGYHDSWCPAYEMPSKERQCECGWYGVEQAGMNEGNG